MNKIPKIIHQIWISPDNKELTIPVSQQSYIETVKLKHQHWSHILWTRQTILKEFDLENAFENASNDAQRSDIARYAILHKYGGVYLDTDIEVLKDLDPLLDERTSFAASEDGRYLSNAVLATVPKSKLYSNLLEHLPRDMGMLPTNIETGPVYFTKTLFLSGCESFSILPPYYFYPYTHKTIGEINEQSLVNSYAVHHYAGSWTRKTSLARRLLHKFNKIRQ